MESNPKRWAVVFLVLLLGLGLVGTALGASREQLLDLYKGVRKAILDEDLAAFDKLVLPPDPAAPKMTKKDLTEAKGFIDDIFPDPDKSRLLKFDANDQEAIMVLQTHLEDKENITLSGFRFQNKGGKWMLLASLVNKSFTSEGEEKDRETIEKTLANNESFLLKGQAKAREAASAAPAGPAGTCSGHLTVAGKAYNLGHSFAFRKKALGYDDKINIHVVLTEEEVPSGKVQAQLREKDEWSDFINNLQITFDPELKPEGISFWVKHESTSFSGSASDVISEAKVEGDRIKGAVKIEKPRKLFGDTYIYDVTFDAPIIAK